MPARLQELAAERHAVRDAVTRLRLVPVMFELAAPGRTRRGRSTRPTWRKARSSSAFTGRVTAWSHPARISPGWRMSTCRRPGCPRLIYVKSPAPQRDPRLAKLLARIRDDGSVSYQHFSTRAELRRLVEDDLAVLLSERFEMTRPRDGARAAEEAPLARALPVPVTPLMGRDQEAARSRIWCLRRACGWWP